MINDINFTDFTKNEGEIKRHIKKFFLYPEYWNKLEYQLPKKIRWQNIKFSLINKNKIPKKKGLYAFVLIPDYDNFIETRYLFYVGKTNRTLALRFNEYIAEMNGKSKYRIKIWKMLNQYKNHLYFFYAEIDNETDVNLSEECLINTFVPHVNTQIPDAIVKPELKNLYE